MHDHFSIGDASELHAVSPSEAASNHVDLAGGEADLAERATEAANYGDHKWAAEMAQHLVTFRGERCDEGKASD